MTVEIDGANNIVKTNTISEVTSANGVTVDGLNIKDSKLVTANSVITANITDANVTTAKITDANVTQGKIADQAINEAKMQISNAPVNGYALTAQSGNTGGMTWAEAGGGAVNLITTITVSGTSTSAIEFTGLDNSYKMYMIDFTNFKQTRAGSTGATIYLRVNTSGGTQTGSNYDHAGLRIIGSAGNGTWGNTGQTAVPLTPSNIKISEGLNARFFIADPSQTANRKYCWYNFAAPDASGALMTGVAVWSYQANDAFTGIYFYTSGDNFTAGSVAKLYGVT